MIKTNENDIIGQADLFNVPCIWQMWWLNLISLKSFNVMMKIASENHSVSRSNQRTMLSELKVL